MSAIWQIRVYENHQLVHSGEVTGSVELGRQADLSEKPYSQKQDKPTDPWRVVIARLGDHNVSRRHALVEPLQGNRVRLKNVSQRQTIRLFDGTELRPEGSRETVLPMLFTLGSKTIRIQETEADDLPLQSLSEATVAPGSGALRPASLAAFSAPAESRGAMESFVHMLQGAMDVLQSAAGNSEFLVKAARTAVDLVGLDSGRVLLWENGECKVQALQTGARATAELGWQPSRQVLTQVWQHRRTFWQEPEQSALQLGSLLGVKAVIAAPILNRQAEVIGVLYGERRQESNTGAAGPITRLEAMLMELLAGGIAAGLARVEQEQAALRARVQFEQFFTKELSLQLAAQPDLLEGRDSEVTILFCDIRGFSRISERLGPTGTVKWIADIMGALSDCVLNTGGVVVDYIGDELMAMWGAPVPQPDHAQRACRAALDMIDLLPKLNVRWQPTLQEAMGLGVGINTGTARVGNVGTARKFKYGPLGNTVNLASRVQGATKYLKTRLLITQATQALLDASFLTRRLCRVRVVNIQEPVDLYELVVPGQHGLPDLKVEYEKALAEFEKKHFRSAARILGPLVAEHLNDGPSLVLMSRAVNALVLDSSDFDPVWELPGK
jgi:adenylate cyclase